MEVMDEVWEVMEEEPGLEDNIANGLKKQVFRKKDQKPWDQELQVLKCICNWNARYIYIRVNWRGQSLAVWLL